MFSKAIKIFTAFGFEIKVDPSWLLIAALITWSLSAHYFPTFLPEQTQSVYLIMALVAMFGFFTSLLIHEMAHSVVARHYGVGIKGITLFIFGGIAELENEPPTAGIEFWIALAGPAMSLTLAFCFWIIGELSLVLGAQEPVSQVLLYLSTINLILAVFNLVPAFPLDGGRVLRAYLWNRSGDILQATATAARSGTVFAYVLIGFGTLMLFSGQNLGGLWQIFIGGFLLLAARSSYQQQLMKSAFKGKTVRNLMTESPIVVDPNMTLSELVQNVMLRRHTGFVPVVEHGSVLGYVDSAVLNGIEHENWSDIRVADVFSPADAENCVSPHLTATELFERITRTGRRKYLVVDGHRLLGVITVTDLLGYLTLLQELHTKPQGA